MCPPGPGAQFPGAQGVSGITKRDLSDVWLRALKPPIRGRFELRDARVMGLVLRITPTGVATWSVRTRTRDGKQTRPALGTWPAMGIAEARRAALAALAAVQSGADPVADRRKEREGRRASLREATVAARLAEWQADRIGNPVNPWSDRYAAEVERAAAHDIIPRLGSRKLVHTTRADWTALVAAKRKGAPAMAAALYRLASAFLTHAEASGWIEHNPLPRRGAGTLAAPPAPRERVLTDAELLAVWKAADREAPKLRAFVRLLVLTGAREAEVAQIAAGELDLAAGRWTIPAERAKNGRPYTVPLCALALAELRAVWPNETPGPRYRLLGRSGAGGFTGFSRLKERMNSASGVQAWRWHDLRRTARTGMARLGVSSDHAEAAINHVSGRTKLERTYDRHDYAPEVIAALGIWQGHVARLVAP